MRPKVDVVFPGEFESQVEYLKLGNGVLFAAKQLNDQLFGIFSGNIRRVYVRFDSVLFEF